MKSSKKEDQEVWKRMREERKYMYIVAGKSSLGSLHSQPVCFALFLTEDTVHGLFKARQSSR